MDQLVVKEVSVVRGKKSVLSNLNMSFSFGELVAIEGNNGSGKSTFLETLAGLIQPTQGEIWLEGNSLSKLSFAERANYISFIPSRKTTAAALEVRTAIAVGDLVGRKMSRVEEAIEKFNLKNLQDNLLTELSDGEFQRVQLARVWVQDTPIVLLDEPAAHLDANARQELFGELLKWAKEENKLVLLCSHELQLNKQFATRTLQF
ncbi:MAG: ABC transporter ATP-binding protein [Flavobacteriales bacterium]|jgi:iron complex transport system ATP-binding protein